MKTTKREYVDLALFLAANEKTKDFNNIETIDQEFPASRHEIHLYWDHYTMNPNGFHIGEITWKATLPLVKKRIGESNPMQEKVEPDSKWFVDADFPVDIEAVSYPESETCECANKYDCECELYMSPKDDDSWSDFAWQEFEAKINNILKCEVDWVFIPDTGWSIEHVGK